MVKVILEIGLRSSSFLKRKIKVNEVFSMPECEIVSSSPFTSVVELVSQPLSFLFLSSLD